MQYNAWNTGQTKVCVFYIIVRTHVCVLYIMLGTQVCVFYFTLETQVCVFCIILGTQLCVLYITLGTWVSESYITLEHKTVCGFFLPCLKHRSVCCIYIVLLKHMDWSILLSLMALGTLVKTETQAAFIHVRLPCSWHVKCDKGRKLCVFLFVCFFSITP